VRAVIEKKELGLVNNWLRHLTDVSEKSADWLRKFRTDEERANRLCELNVKEQVRNVCQATVVQNAWKSHQRLAVHGWIYGLKDGLLRDLLDKPISSKIEIASI